MGKYVTEAPRNVRSCLRRNRGNRHQTLYQAMKSRTLLLVAVLSFLGVVLAQDHSTISPASTHGQQIHTPDQLKWQEGPPSLPPGAKIAVLEGDPTKEGPFTMRAKMPDGYSVPPHIHPATEHITVISGTFNFGM